jgi:perosamine synthetase
MRYLSTQAKDDPHYYVHNEIGYNYRMTNLQAALGVAQLEELPRFIRNKQQNYRLYSELFSDFELGKLLTFRRGTDSNHWFYSLEISMDKINGSLRDIITSLEEKGVQTRAIWGLIHEQLPYKNCKTYRIERAKYYSGCIINLPCSTSITEKEINYVVESVKEVLGEMANV